MKQKNGAWLLALAAMLCSIGGVCIKGVPWTPLAINGCLLYTSDAADD